MARESLQIWWVDGQLVPCDRPVVRADDSAFCEGRGVFTSIRIGGGRPRFADRHLRRLRRGARDLRLGELDAAQVERALSELSEAAFPDGDGVIRLQLSRDGEGRLHLVGTPRALGAERPEWSAIIAPCAHSGVVLPGGHKLTSRPVLALAAELAREAGVDEALLFNRAGDLVEGAISNVLVVTRDGTLATPPVELGAVDGIALQVIRERVSELAPRHLEHRDVRSAREIIAVNSVRGARPIIRLDGRPVFGGQPGPWAARLAETLAED